MTAKQAANGGPGQASGARTLEGLQDLVGYRIAERGPEDVARGCLAVIPDGQRRFQVLPQPGPGGRREIILCFKNIFWLQLENKLEDMKTIDGNALFKEIEPAKTEDDKGTGPSPIACRYVPTYSGRRGEAGHSGISHPSLLGADRCCA
jgi:hypothetical protein